MAKTKKHNQASFFSPNMDSTKLKYEDGDQNESEAENDSHKSNSKTNKRVLATNDENQGFKRTLVYEK